MPATAAASTAAYGYAEFGPWSLATVRRDGFRNRVTLTFHLLISGSMHAKRLLYSIRVPSRFPVTARTNRLYRHG